MTDRTALIVIDMLNPYDHEHADVLVDDVARIVPAVARLVAAAGDAELVYVNDNYEDFAASRADIVRRALDGRRSDLVEPIVPRGQDLGHAALTMMERNMQVDVITAADLEAARRG